DGYSPPPRPSPSEGGGERDLRATRLPSDVSTSCEIVPLHSATSSAVIPSPISVTTSPLPPPRPSVTSTLIASMLTRPTSGARRPATTTDPRLTRPHITPSSYPMATVATRDGRGATQARP